MGLTFFTCPHCGNSLGTRSGLRGKLQDIGPSVIECPHCKKPVRTGSSEWAEKSAFEKGKIVTENYLWGGVFLGGMVSVLVTATLHGGLGAPLGAALVVGCIVWAGVIAMAHGTHKEDVKESLARKPGEKVLSENIVTPAPRKHSTQPSSTPADELMKYAALLQKGLISKEEFEKKKSELL